MSRKITTVLGLLLAFSMVLAACAPAKTSTPVATEPPATEPPVVEPTAVPTEPPSTRTGAWVDEVVFTSIDEVPIAVAQLQADALDLYAYLAEDPETFQIVKEDPNLAYSMAYGSWDSYMFNTYGEATGDHLFADGRLNPMSIRKVREAINYLIDRDYLVQEVMGGLANPRYVGLLGTFPDYARFADLIRPIEAKYAYNVETAVSMIAEAMTAAGATLDANGKWSFNGAVVTVIALIRSEDEREALGNYLCDQLELPEVGLTCDRQVRTRSELSPIWSQSVTAEGQWNFYTAGNYYPSLVRDEGSYFLGSFSPSVAGTTAEATFYSTPEEEAVYQALYTNAFTSMDERRALFAQALPMSVENSSYLQILEPASFAPFKADLIVGSDLSSGVAGSQIWPFTIRWAGQEGGSVRSANSGILTGPWNPISGHNWNQEFNIINATRDVAAMANPYTGLYMPQWLESGTLKVVTGTVTNKTLDWVTLETADSIPVPGDAWADFDPATNQFITVAEKFPEGTTAKGVSTVVYRADMFDKLTWHDGSPFSMADFMTQIITTFDNCHPESLVYDETIATNCEVFFSHFKGLRIVSTDPVTIETYDDLVDLDAEVHIGGYGYHNWFPYTATGILAWHSYVPAYLAESKSEIAFTTEKSTALGVEWTNYVGGPSLDFMKAALDQAQADNYIPWAETMSAYITADEATARYANLQAFYAAKGHFWVGIGPFYVDQINAVEGSVVAKRYEAYPELASKWSIFGAPPLSVVDVSGPGSVTKGQEAAFDAFITFQDAPYASADLSSVSYLLYDASGALVGTGAATAIAEGQYQAVLTAAQTGALAAGSAKIEFVVVSKLVAIPTFASMEFVVSQ